MSMASFKSSPMVVEGNPHLTHSVQQHQLGSVMWLPDGRAFRYAKAGASGISAGKLQLAPARKTNHDNVAAYAAAVAGATEIVLTLGATAAVANEYAEGFLIASDVAPEGTTLQIGYHPAADASATLRLTLIDTLPEAVTTTSEFCLVHNPHNAVIESTDNQAEAKTPVGIPLVDIAAGYYGWVQTHGIAPALADETLTLGAQLAAGSSVAGAVEELDDAAAPFTQRSIGYAIVAGVDTEYRPIFLTID